MMCSIPISVALSLSGAYPKPISFVGRCIASVGKLGMRPSAFLAALLSILSIVCSVYCVCEFPQVDDVVLGLEELVYHKLFFIWE